MFYTYILFVPFNLIWLELTEICPAYSKYDIILKRPGVLVPENVKPDISLVLNFDCRCVPFGKCPSHRNSSNIPQHFMSPDCNSSDFELSMIWEKEQLKKVFAPNRPPALVGLVAGKNVEADLEFKLGGRNWKAYKVCGSGLMRVISTNSTLR